MTTVPTKRQIAKTNRRLAKYGTDNPRYRSVWWDGYWSRYKLVWLPSLDYPNTLVCLPVCLDCLRPAEFGDDDKPWCEPCWMDYSGYSDSEVESMYRTSLREDESRFIAAHGEPDLSRRL